MHGFWLLCLFVVALGGAFACSPGWRDIGGQCAICQVGRYSFDGVVCIDCAPGYHASSQGSTQCAPCPAGSVSNSIVGYQSCTLCGPGFYQPFSGTMRCGACAPGLYSSVTGSVECITCGPGTFSNHSASTSCSACPLGKWSRANSSECQECPDKLYPKDPFEMRLCAVAEARSAVTNDTGLPPAPCAEDGRLNNDTAAITVTIFAVVVFLVFVARVTLGKP